MSRAFAHFCIISGRYMAICMLRSIFDHLFVYKANNDTLLWWCAAPRLVAVSLAVSPDGEAVTLSLKALPPPKASSFAAAAQSLTANIYATAAGAAHADIGIPAGGSPTSTTTTAHIADGGSVHSGQSAAFALLPQQGLPPLQQHPQPQQQGWPQQAVKHEAAPLNALAAAQPQQGGWHAGPPPAQHQSYPGSDANASASFQLAGGRGMRRIESTESSLHGSGLGGRRGIKRDSADTVEDEEVCRKPVKLSHF